MAAIAALTENFEAGPVGGDLLTSNSIFDNVGANRLQFTSTAIEGSLAVATVGTTIQVAEADFTGVGTLWVGFYLRLAANATSNTGIFQCYGNGNSAKVLDVRILAGGSDIQLRSVSTNEWTGTSLALNQWHRIAIGMTVGTNCQLKVYSGANLHGTTPSQQSGVRPNTNTVATNVDNIRIGQMTADDTLVAIFDRLRGDDASEVAAMAASGAAAGTGSIALSGTAGAVGGIAVPTGLTATPVSPTQINLAWNAVSGATGYDIERNGSVVVLDHPTNSYSDTSLTPATSYTYRVRSVQ